MGDIMEIIKLSEPQHILSFIDTAQYHTASYLYKLPQAHQQIESFIARAAEDPGVFALIDGSNDIQALILALKYDTNRYKVIGPFLHPDFELDAHHFKQLFHAMTENQPTHANFNFSFEEHEQRYEDLMKTIQAGYYFTDYHLSAHQDVGTVERKQNITSYRPAYFHMFSKLHQETFKHDALTAQQIVDSLDSDHHLFMFMSEGILKGYVYLTFHPSNHTAEIKYFTSHTDYRFKGIAFDLLKYALHFAFEREDLNTIYFKIRSKNYRLVERFNELGFHVNHKYDKYKYVASHLQQR